jgi:Transposase DDE domain group 1
VVTLALGGDCLADIAVLRVQPELAGPVASDPVVSRLISALAADAPRALKAIRKARAAARERAWALAGDRAPGGDGSLIPVDIDATIVTAHSEKEKAAPTWCELVAMACELTAWMQMLALDGPARAWEPKRLRLRLFAAAGRLARGGRRMRMRIAATWPWATQLTAAISRLQALAPGCPAGTAPATRKGDLRARGTPPTRRDSRATAYDRPLTTSNQS